MFLFTTVKTSVYLSVKLLNDEMARAIIKSDRGGGIMASVKSAIQNTVSISDFNRGLAGRIFEDVKRSGAKVVMKNNAAECVLISPDEYIALMDDLDEARLVSKTLKRLAKLDSSALISQEEADHILGFTEDDLKGFDEVEFE